ncbi:MAG: S8 family serine peptidase [Alphaproteobacteria bacterium]|nr:S8 family serine peptidase [Alphaproteobacteria bacterium]
MASAPAPPLCVQTHDRGCLTESEFEVQASELASSFTDTESFGNQWGLAAIGLDRAYANLELLLGPDAKAGEGQTVGILDTGIDSNFPAFESKSVFRRLLRGARHEDGSEFSHGTAVASIIAGVEHPDFGTDASGIAWGADIAMFATPLGTGDGTYRPHSTGDLGSTGNDFADMFTGILAWRDGTRRIDFLNLSLGADGIIERYSGSVLRQPMKPLVEVMAQDGAADKTVFVWAAGNSHGDMCDPALDECVDGKVDASSPSLLAGLAARFPELKENTLAVVAIKQDGGITDFSNRCGIAEDFCLAAPGEDVAVAYFGPHQGRSGVRGTARAPGTSFAAPMVTGGLLLMKQLFRDQLSNTDLAARLLETADRSGVYADAAIYGRGLMDLGAATSPVGEPVIAVASHVGGPGGAALNDTSLQLGPAFGDAFAAAFGEREIAAFDELGAPFWYSFGGLSRTAAAPALSARLHEFQQLSLAAPAEPEDNAYRILLTEAPGGGGPALHLVTSGASAAANAGHFALAEQSLVATIPVAADLTAIALTTEGMSGQEPATGAALAWRAPESAFGLRAGWLGERRTLLGTVPEGAFGSLGGDAAFAGVEADMDLGAWRLGGNAEVGTVRARAHGGVFEELSSLATRAFALHATRRTRNGGAFRVSLSQPLRIENGRAWLALPSGRTRAGAVVRDRVRVGMEPGGRQLDLALHWRQPLGIGDLRLGATLSREPGHRNGADAEAILFSGWRLSL